MSKSPVQFVAECSYNKLYLLQSLDENESQTGTRLALDTLTPLCRQLGFGLKGYEIKSRAQLFQALDIIAQECSNDQKPIYPILHLEIHGSSDGSGLVISPSDEIVTWNEFAEKCRNINRACKNNLFVVMAVCHGFKSILAVDIKDVTPFYILIGPERTVTTGFILDRFPKFYEILIRKQNIDSAMQAIADEYRMYLSEFLFFKAFFKYTKEHCVGEGKIQRIEELIGKIQTNIGGELENPDEIKNQLNEFINPSQDAFNKFKTRFLMFDVAENADRFPFTFENLLNIL